MSEEEEGTTYERVERKPSITNKQLRLLGWLSFAAAVGIPTAQALTGYDFDTALVWAFLANAGVSFGLPTYRNIMEEKYDAQRYP